MHFIVIVLNKINFVIVFLYDNDLREVYLFLVAGKARNQESVLIKQ